MSHPTKSDRRALAEGQIALRRAMTWFEDTRLEGETNEVWMVLARLKKLESEWECLPEGESTI